MREIILIAHNLRSAHNVGSLLRTADGIGVRRVYLTGYTPYPRQADDPRLPHEAQRTDKQIAKTALGAEQTAEWLYEAAIGPVISELKKSGFTVAALEQSAGSVRLPDFRPPEKLAIIVGREVEGIEPEILQLCDTVLEIPMLGKKESFNVAAAAAIALYHCLYS